jgi:hypothetical protein
MSPYVDQLVRTQLKGRPPRTAGELNYIITRLLMDYLPYKPNYGDFNEVLGALESCKLEFYRRQMAAYEDVKLNKNGDVYDARQA